MAHESQSNPSKDHWVVVKNILKYLRRTKNVFLIYGDGDSDLHMKGYTDEASNLIEMAPNLNQVMCSH